MKRTTWALAVMSLAGAVWNGARADDSGFKESRSDDRSAVRRATDFFSRGGKTTTDVDPVDAAQNAPKKPAAKPAAGTANAGVFDSRLRPKASVAPVNATAEKPEFTEDDEIPFGTSEPSSSGAAQSKLRLKPKSPGGAVTVGAAMEESATDSKARTPSGAPLERGLSDDEAGSRVVHARNTEPVGGGEPIQQVNAQTPGEENPFVPVEEFLKNAPPKAKKPLVQRPVPPARNSAAVRNPGLTRTVSTFPAATEPEQPASRTTLGGRIAAKPAEKEPTAFSEPLESSRSTSSEEDAPKVTVRWMKRSEINVGQPCECDLIVQNHGGSGAKEVTVEAYFPKTVRLTSSNPEPTEVTDHLAWTFPSLGAGEVKTIRIGLIPSRKGDLSTSASVRFTGSAEGVFTVTEPMLAVQVKGPKEVLVGDPASHIIVVSNPGNGMANNVVVEAVIPKGLEHPRGEKLVMEVGSLGPGESRTVRLALSAVAGGQHQVQVVARADSELLQTAAADVVVVAPSIKLGIDGPGLRYVGRVAQYQLLVVNDGAAPSNNVRVMHKIPEGFRFERAEKGGKYDEASQTVSWFVGRIEPGQNTTVKLDLTPTKLGTFKHQAGAISEQGAKADATLETVVDGTAAVQLEVVEQSDPVEVGSEAVYEIRLKNAGSKSAQNVGISCELASAVQLVTASGPSEFLSENGLVIFKSLPNLPAGKTAVFRVTVKGTQEGSHRFRVRLASDSITEPLISEELTKFYAE